MTTTVIPDDIQSKLLKYQIPHVDGLVYSLKTYNRALDASDTGTGKTYTAIATAKTLGLKPFIICPKSVISSWRNVMNFFNVKSYGVSNYELIQNCKQYVDNQGNERVTCPFIKVKMLTDKENVKVDNGKVTVTKGKKTKDNNNKDNLEYTYIWSLPKDALIIFDETHRCKNSISNNHHLLFTLNQYQTKILMLSATVSDKPDNFHLVGYVLGLYSSLRNAKSWIRSTGAEFENPMQGIHDALYPEYASRMRIRDLGNLFPDNQVIAECYDMETAKEIEEQYKVIEAELEKLKEEEQATCGLGKIVKARQKIETLKIPTFIDMAKQYLEEGASVAIFVNFTQTLMTIAEELKTTCTIHGQQTMDERDKSISDFNNDTARVIVCNIKAGGVGISLHDQKGVYPRISIISPSWSAQDIIQALGRIHRAKGMTPVRQRIVFCKDTIEEDICESMKEKIVNIGALNDGDMKSYKIEGLIDDKTLGVDPNAGLSEMEKVFQKITVLNVKKKRLEDDLKEVDKEINELVTQMEGMIK